MKIKFKVSEADGQILDWLVAKAAGYLDIQPGYTKPRVVLDMHHWVDRPAVRWNPTPDVYYKSEFTPSDDWGHGGPIIGRERITLRTSTLPGFWAAFYDVPGEYHAHIRERGPTALVAAMRCFVTKHLGREVDIPEELCK